MPKNNWWDRFLKALSNPGGYGLNQMSPAPGMGYPGIHEAKERPKPIIPAPVGMGGYQGKPMPPISTIESVYGKGVKTLPQKSDTGYLWGYGGWTSYAPPAQGQASATTTKLQELYSQKKAQPAVEYGYNPQGKVELGGGMYYLPERGSWTQTVYNSSGKKVGTYNPVTGTFQYNHRRLSGKNYKHNLTPEEVYLRNAEMGKLGPTIKNIQKQRSGNSGGNSGSGYGGSNLFYGNELISWRI